jgi:hypothetical protein
LKNSGVLPPKLDGKSGLKPLSSDVAARIIVDGIEKKKRYIFVGRDASLMDKLSRLNPAFAGRMIAKAMRSS